MNKAISIPPPELPLVGQLVLTGSPIFGDVEAIHDLSTSFSRPSKIAQKNKLVCIYMHESPFPKMAKPKHGIAWPMWTYLCAKTGNHAIMGGTLLMASKVAQILIIR